MIIIVRFLLCSPNQSEMKMSHELLGRFITSNEEVLLLEFCTIMAKKKVFNSFRITDLEAMGILLSLVHPPQLVTCSLSVEFQTARLHVHFSLSLFVSQTLSCCGMCKTHLQWEISLSLSLSLNTPTIYVSARLPHMESGLSHSHEAHLSHSWMYSACRTQQSATPGLIAGFI